jgi:hypothetical protein
MRAIASYNLILEMIDYFLVVCEGAKDICRKLFLPESGKYNAGVNKIQENKLEKSLREFEGIWREERWDDVLDLGPRISSYLLEE